MVVEASGLRKEYGETVALDGIDVSFPSGEMVALLGPNGSGKSTLLGLVGGWLRLSGGSLRVLGADAAGALPRSVRARLGVAFQSESLDPLLTVRENLELHAATSGVDRSWALEAIESHGLSEVANQRVKTLSGGWARRADLARAMLTRPALLLLDEPTAGLDPRAREAWMNALATFCESVPDATIVLTTHLLDEGLAADRVVLLDRGRVVADDTPDALIGGERFVVEAEDGERAQVDRVGLAEVCARFGERASPFGVRRRSLDDVFLERTGRGLEAVGAA